MSVNEAMGKDLLEEELLSLLLEEEGMAAAAPAINVRPRAATTSAPLSFEQQRLWLLDQLAPGSHTYNLPRAFRLLGRLDATALERSLREIVRRHESLRTTFRVTAGEPAQVVAPAGDFSLTRSDLGGVPAERREAEAAAAVRAESLRPFDLEAGPLFRCSLFRLSEDEHVLLLVMHHIVSDGWSMGVLIRELTALYTAYLEGRESPLEELPVQYADYAVWQREQLQGEALEEQLGYWREQLAGVPVLELPTDHPRPAVQSPRGAVETLALSRGLSDELRELSRREGATLFMTLLAAWQALLSRYSNQQDISVGSPIAGRGRQELEGLVGFFVNTLVLRTRVEGGESFRELLGRVRETCLGAYAHQEVPFEKVVEDLQPERSLSHSPLFQVMFALQNIPQEELLLPGLMQREEKVEAGAGLFDLTLVADAQEEDAIALSLVYSGDLFEGATAARMLRHFGTLLEAAVGDPDAAVSGLRLMGEAEACELLAAWNDTRRAYPKDVLLTQLFERQAARTPDAVAVIAGGERLTYGELNRRANRLAADLRARGVGPETPVGILMERSAEMLVGLLGVLKAGGAYVPLDPLYPRERLAFVVADTGMRVLLTQDGLDVLAGGLVKQVVLLGADAGRDADTPEVNFDGGATADNLAYVVYTSGSTGKPKGVQVTHAALSNFVHSFAAEPGLDSRDVLLAVTSLSFDIAVFELFVTLATGARVVIASRETAADAEGLRRALEEYGVTAMQATPVTWRLLAEAGREGSKPLKKLCGGEALQPKLAAALLGDGGPLWNCYGPSETTVWSTLQRVERRDAEAASVSIGRPVANTQVFILDAGLRPVPVGVPGELYIGGEGVARGYQGRPGLTAERFIPDPFTGRPGARLYRTGDLARYLEDGRVEFRGRADHQVKIRGFRIELGEIDTVLTGHPGVGACVVVAAAGPDGEARLVAYLTADGGAPSPRELRDFMRRQLPEYMIPSAFVVLDGFPLTTSGKIDRKALPAPDAAQVEDEYVAPRDATEERMAAVWSEVLKVERVGVNDNFFGRGGHSLLAMIVVSRVRNLFGVELPLRSLFENPTVASLCAVVAGGQGGPRESSAAIGRISQGDDDLDALLAELDKLSDEEARTLLADELPSVKQS